MAEIMRAVFDFETDPFEHGATIQPFCVGLLTEDGDYWDYWGDDCAEKLIEKLESFDEKMDVYAHNGGKFDFHFLLDHIDDQDLKIINGRIAKIKVGRCTLIDSYLLMPFSLDTYNKSSIDYNKFHVDVRDDHKTEILDYLESDCRNLLNLLAGFQDLGGRHLTVGGCAVAQMKIMGYDIPQCSEEHDEKFRPFFYGGRVQAFERGIFRGNLHYIDINSAYPFAMMHTHPVGEVYTASAKIPESGHCFSEITAISHGALPWRGEDGRLSFPDDGEPRTYLATGWEILAGIETGKLDIIKVHRTLAPKNVITFKKFVGKFWDAREKYKSCGDKIGAIFCKYMLNSGYGKFATDPRKFKKYALTGIDDYLDNWTHVTDITINRALWERPDYWGRGFYDVATAASITGFVRAYLFKTLCKAGRPLYCDTDSIIYMGKKLSGLGKELGQWQSEGKTAEVRIAGKKLYAALIDGEWKIASKGVSLDEHEIKRIIKGESIQWKNEFPTFSLKRGQFYVERTIKLV